MKETPEERADRLLDEYQREYVKWHDFEKCGASPELLNRQRDKLLRLHETVSGALYATGLDSMSYPSAYFTPIPPKKKEGR